jgi:hypothetical protein
VQVDQFRQNIESARANLLGQQVTYDTQLDVYKAQNLDFPPDVKVEIDDSMLRQFEFVDPKTTGVQRLVEDFINVIGELPTEPSPADMSNAVEVLTRLRSQVAEQFESGHADLKALEAKVPERKQRMTDAQRVEFDEELAKLTQSLEDVENRFQQTEPVLQSIRDRLGTEAPSKLTDEIVALSTGLSGLTQELLLVKARARLEAVTVPHVELPSDRALDIARANRLDWMNNRASLVDQWRLIAFNANALKAGLDVFFSGDLGTVGNNPVAFNGQNGSLRVGMRFDAPFTRRLERNDYRSVLIQYQFQRRLLYQYQDTVNFTLRNLLRTLGQLEVNLEIQRRAMVIAIRRVDKTREDLNEPPAPTLPGQPVQLLGPTVAQNLIFALNDLLSSQNVFMSVILNHYENRMLLYRELGIMELDDCGIWIDKPLNESDWLTEEQCPTPPAVPQQWLEDVGVDASDLQAYAERHAAQGNLDPAIAGLGQLPPAETDAAGSPHESAGNLDQEAGSGLTPLIDARRSEPAGPLAARIAESAGTTLRRQPPSPSTGTRSGPGGMSQRPPWPDDLDEPTARATDAPRDELPARHPLLRR